MKKRIIIRGKKKFFSLKSPFTYQVLSIKARHDLNILTYLHLCHLFIKMFNLLEILKYSSLYFLSYSNYLYLLF